MFALKRPARQAATNGKFLNENVFFRYCFFFFFFLFRAYLANREYLPHNVYELLLFIVLNKFVYQQQHIVWYVAKKIHYSIIDGVCLTHHSSVCLTVCLIFMMEWHLIEITDNQTLVLYVQMCV